MIRTFCLAALALTPLAHAQTGRTQSCSAIIPAPAEEVWNAFTTESGIEAWMVPVTSIDLRIGGEWRTSYNPASTLDDGDTIVHTILAYEPQRMLAVRTAPPANASAFFGGVDFSQLWNVYRFEPVEGGTRLTVTGLGYGEGEAWDKVYSFFETNNPLVLEELSRHLSGSGDADDSERILALLHRWVGGEWIHEGSPPGGGVFRVRNLVTAGPDGSSLLCQGWLGDQDGMVPHSLAIVRRSVDGGIVFENVSETGEVATGPITLVDDDTLHWAWDVTRLDGSTVRYSITMDFPQDHDTYRMALRLIETDGSGSQTLQPMVDVTFDRVDHAPDHFHGLAVDAPQPGASHADH